MSSVGRRGQHQRRLPPKVTALLSGSGMEAAPLQHDAVADRPRARGRPRSRAEAGPGRGRTAAAAAPLPALSTSCVFVPSGSGTAGIVDLRALGRGLDRGAAHAADRRAEAWPCRPSPRRAPPAPAWRRRARAAVALASRAHVTLDRPASGPRSSGPRPGPGPWRRPGTTASSAVGVAAVTCAFACRRGPCSGRVRAKSCRRSSPSRRRSTRRAAGSRRARAASCGGRGTRRARPRARATAEAARGRHERDRGIEKLPAAGLRLALRLRRGGSAGRARAATRGTRRARRRCRARRGSTAAPVVLRLARRLGAWAARVAGGGGGARRSGSRAAGGGGAGGAGARTGARGRGGARRGSAGGWGGSGVANSGSSPASPASASAPRSKCGVAVPDSSPPNESAGASRRATAPRRHRARAQRCVLVASVGDSPAPGSSTSSLALPLAPGVRGRSGRLAAAGAGHRPSRRSRRCRWRCPRPRSRGPVCVSSSWAWKGSTLPSMIWTPASMLEPITSRGWSGRSG